MRSGSGAVSIMGGRHCPSARPVLSPPRDARGAARFEHDGEAQRHLVGRVAVDDLDRGAAMERELEPLADVIERHAVAAADRPRVSETGLAISITTSSPSSRPSTVTTPPSGSGSMP